MLDVLIYYREIRTNMITLQQQDLEYVRGFQKYAVS